MHRQKMVVTLGSRCALACLLAVVGSAADAATVIQEFLVPTPASQPVVITEGPDSNLWFTEQAGNQIGRITTAGADQGVPDSHASSLPPSSRAASVQARRRHARNAGERLASHASGLERGGRVILARALVRPAVGRSAVSRLLPFHRRLPFKNARLDPSPPAM